MSSGEEIILQSQRRALARRFFARVFFACLLGLNVPVFATLFDSLFSPARQISTLLVQAAAILTLVVIVNSVSIGIVTTTSYFSQSARPPWWVLPASLGIVAGLILIALSLLGVTTLYQNLMNAFVVGTVAGVAVGGAYTLSMPGLRQGTILKQSRRSIIIGGVVGVQYGVYFLLKEMPPYATSAFLVYHVVTSIVGVPILITGLLLSFVLGIELGDRYVER